MACTRRHESLVQGIRENGISRPNLAWTSQAFVSETAVRAPKREQERKKGSSLAAGETEGLTRAERAANVKPIASAWESDQLLLLSRSALFWAALLSTPKKTLVSMCLKPRQHKSKPAPPPIFWRSSPRLPTSLRPLVQAARTRRRKSKPAARNKSTSGGHRNDRPGRNSSLAGAAQRRCGFFAPVSPRQSPSHPTVLPTGNGMFPLPPPLRGGRARIFRALILRRRTRPGALYGSQPALRNLRFVGGAASGRFGKTSANATIALVSGRAGGMRDR